tara:strand:- start:72 stop:260 length:189 start_codon:yes stop_codon:yes gene_type:complete
VYHGIRIVNGRDPCRDYILTVAIVTATSILDWVGIVALIPIDLSVDWMQVQIHFILANTAIN